MGTDSHLTVPLGFLRTGQPVHQSLTEVSIEGFSFSVVEGQPRVCVHVLEVPEEGSGGETTD